MVIHFLSWNNDKIRRIEINTNFDSKKRIQVFDKSEVKYS